MDSLGNFTADVECPEYVRSDVEAVNPQGIIEVDVEAPAVVSSDVEQADEP